MELRVKYIGLLLALTAAALAQSANAQINQLSPGQMFPPGQSCPDLACTLEFIPEECREIPIININGNNCTGCPRWRESCRRTPSIYPTIQCPVIRCPTLTVSKECQIAEPYEYHGKRCFSCPKVNPDCSNLSPLTPTAACPVRACPLMFIPQECREETTFDFMGRKCSGCPKWRSACKPTLANPFNVIPPLSAADGIATCPMIACDSFVPAECQVKKDYQFRGLTCPGCPTWRVGCREAERAIQIANPSVGGRVPVPSVNCPLFPCPAVQIPPNCVEQQPYEYRGKTCYRCPQWREGCVAPSVPGNGQVISPEIPCPLIKCSPLNVPKYCLQEQTYQFNGRTCNNCPDIKPECRSLFQTNLLTDLTRAMPADVTCPVRRCPLIYIPKECLEIEKFEFEGKSCLGCPRYRVGCVPGLTSNGVNQSKPNNLTASVEVECPMVGCPMIYIPSACKIEQSYQFQGKTCYGCPKRKENCTTQQNGFMNGENTTPPTECPVLQCNRMLIPEVCRVVEEYDFNGKTCYMCPKFKEGCTPNASSAGFTSTNKPVLANLAPVDPQTKPFDVSQTIIPQISCPSFECAQLNVPAECIEEQRYQYMGKTCVKCPVAKPNCPAVQRLNTVTTTCPLPKCNKMLIPQECMEIPLTTVNGVECPQCPRWKEGCRPNMERNPSGTPLSSKEAISNRGRIVTPVYSQQENPAEQTTPTPVNKEQQQQTSEASPTPSISGMNGLLPVRRFMSVVQATVCPRLPCPNLGIPEACKLYGTYMYNGISCPGCPVVRPNCRGAPIGQQNFNMNGILAYSLFNEMMK